MKILSAMLVLVTCAGCSTMSPLRHAEFSHAPLAQVDAAVELESGTVDILGVHGQVQYWDGSLWSELRPNMVLTNCAQIRPGADSCVDLRHDHCVTVRLLADHRLNVQALVVRHLKGRKTTLEEPALEGGPTFASATTTPEPTALQIQAGGVLGRYRDADFAIFADGNVAAVKGSVIVTGRGKTWTLREGDSLGSTADNSQKEDTSEIGQVSAQSRTMSAWLVVDVPKSEALELGMLTSWRGTPRLGE